MSDDAFERLPIHPPFPPMEAKLVTALPRGDHWQYEPKWDGFRCLAFRDGDAVRLQSKAGQPLERYFPEIVEALRALRPKRFVLDGEIVIPSGDTFAFDELLQRIHPAESRVKKLAAEWPASLFAFDLLVDERGASHVEDPLPERRARLEAFAEAYFAGDPRLRLSPATTDRRVVERWQDELRGRGIDGIIAKRTDVPYASGDRSGMQKMKWMRTADCVVGGFRYAEKGGFGSLLLGLFDDEGKLDHVGFCSSLRAEEKDGLVEKLEALRAPPGFTGRAPGGPSRWNRGRSTAWEPLAWELVVEVQYDHFSGGRFRHGTKFLRWRPDKAPRQCTFDQLAIPRRRERAAHRRAS